MHFGALGCLLPVLRSQSTVALGLLLHGTCSSRPQGKRGTHFPADTVAARLCHAELWVRRVWPAAMRRDSTHSLGVSGGGTGAAVFQIAKFFFLC